METQADKAVSVGLNQNYMALSACLVAELTGTFLAIAASPKISRRQTWTDHRSWGSGLRGRAESVDPGVGKVDPRLGRGAQRHAAVRGDALV